MDPVYGSEGQRLCPPPALPPFQAIEHRADAYANGAFDNRPEDSPRKDPVERPPKSDDVYVGPQLATVTSTQSMHDAYLVSPEKEVGPTDHGLSSEDCDTGTRTSTQAIPSGIFLLEQAIALERAEGFSFDDGAFTFAVLRERRFGPADPALLSIPCSWPHDVDDYNCSESTVSTELSESPPDHEARRGLDMHSVALLICALLYAVMTLFAAADIRLEPIQRLIQDAPPDRLDLCKAGRKGIDQKIQTARSLVLRAEALYANMPWIAIELAAQAESELFCNSEVAASLNERQLCQRLEGFARLLLPPSEHAEGPLMGCGILEHGL